MKRIYLSTTASLLGALFLISGCSERTIIRGEVIDAFSKPVEGASVRVAGTTFEALTNKAGEYSIPYLPGQVRLLYSKENFIDSDLNLNVAIEATVPAQRVLMVEEPAHPGIWHIGESEYTLLESRQLEAGDGRRFGRSRMIYAPTGTTIEIRDGQRLRFLDNDGKNQILLAVNKDLRVWARTNSGIEASQAQESILSLGQGHYLRETEPIPGRYAFVTERPPRLGNSGGINQEAWPFFFQVSLDKEDKSSPMGSWVGKMLYKELEIHLELEIASSTEYSENFITILSDAGKFGNEGYVLRLADVFASRDSLQFVLLIDSWEFSPHCRLRYSEQTLTGECSENLPEKIRWPIQLSRPPS